MFYRGFKEQASDRCSLDFHSLVISMIVKYCYCGEVDMDSIFNNKRSLEEEAILLVELRKAGSYFEIEELSSAAQAKIGNLVFQKDDDEKNEKYQYASVLLTELFKRGEHNEPLGLLLREFACTNTMECFGPRGAENNNSTDTYIAHPSVLSSVFAKHKDTYAVVRCLQTWFSHESNSAGNGYSDEDKQELIKIAEEIDLKELSMTQLADIKPCSLFSSERILEALAHHCKSRVIIAETPKNVPFMHISGAGMEYLNGPYKRPSHKIDDKFTGEKLNTIFCRKVKHNGFDCASIIHLEHAENKWFISITKDKNTIDLNNDGSVRESSIQIHVYESSCQSLPAEDPKIPPFSGWKCIEGTGPVPLVACIYQ